MSTIGSARWYRALSLNERVALAGDPLETDLELGQRRMRDWRGQTDLNDSGPFSAFLDDINISESRFVGLLGETDHSLQQRCAQLPAWLQQLKTQFASDHVMPALREAFKAEHQEYELLVVVSPILSNLHQQMTGDIQALLAQAPGSLFDLDWLREQFYEQFILWLLWVLRRPMVLELNISRMQQDFSGETPEQRYRQFIEHYGQSENALKILMQYPVAARKIVEQTEIFWPACKRFLKRLINDYQSITSTFFDGADTGKVNDLKVNLSDPHRGGKRVFKISFENGQQLIYKPKSLAVDQCYQQLLGCINQSKQLLPLKTTTVLDKGEYGWVEFVQIKPCSDRAQLERFYQRQGMNMALLYMLKANDFHYENLIADGEHPVLIDLETIYQPQITNMATSRIHAEPGGSTVLSLGLLPYQTGFVGNRNHEIGGMGGASGQALTVRKLTGYNTDELKFTLQSVDSPGSENLPKLDGQTVDAWSMTEQIVEGFNAMYAWLLRHRDALLKDDSPLSAMANVEIRTIFRGTEQYSSMASACWHPDITQNALFKDRLFARLWKRGYQNTLYRKIYAHEVAAMECGDVPLFSTFGNSRDAIVDDQHTVTDIFDLTGEQVVTACLHGLSPMDQKRQQWLIHHALDARRPEHLLNTYMIQSLPQARREVVDRQAYLNQALDIGEHLADLMVTHLDKPVWFDVTLLDAEHRISGLKPMGLALYEGLSGMLMFFAHLSHLSDSQPMSKIRDQLLTRINQAVDKHIGLLNKELGSAAFTGWPGLVYLYLCLAKLYRDDHYLDYANRLITEFADDLSQPNSFDVIGGVCGTLLVLCQWDQSGNHPQAKVLIRQLADWLVASAVEQKTGVAWADDSSEGQALTGFAHGTSGVILALIDAAIALQEPAYLETAQQALAYEDSWFSEQQKTWLDPRAEHKTDDDEYGSVYAWCHGAPGIGLAKVTAARRLEASSLNNEVLLNSLKTGARCAAEATLAHGFGGSHTLCHGDLGNLEVVMAVADYLQDRTMQQQAQQMSIRVLEGIQHNSYRCGGAAGRELLSLMLGLAGIGYGLLRLHSPDQVPSVLLLEV